MASGEVFPVFAALSRPCRAASARAGNEICSSTGWFERGEIRGGSGGGEVFSVFAASFREIAGFRGAISEFVGSRAGGRRVRERAVRLVH